MKSTILVLALLLGYRTASSQTIEDAVRLTTPNGYITTRAGALGLSYAGIADDYAALYYNPAGLSLLTKNEFSIGLEFMNNNTTTSFLQTSTPLRSSFVSPIHCGMVFPFKTKVGIAAIAIGYNKESSFNNTMKLSGFNSTSSIVQSLMEETTDLSQNLAYQVYLADTVGTGKLHSPLKGNVEQSAFISERGGIHSFTVGGGIALSKTVSVGLNVSGKWGSYQYANEYSEQDSKNNYSINDPGTFTTVDFTSLALSSAIDQDFSGVNATFGLQGRFDNTFRLGMSITTPTIYRIDEVFSRTISATFDNGDKATPKYPSGEESYNGQNSYEIITPFVFSASFSYHYEWITISAAASYKDLTQLHFDEAQPALLRLNNQILTTLNGSLTYSFGTEVEIPSTPLVVRAGYTAVSASYINDIEGAEQKILGLGAGIFLAPNVRLDLLTRFNSSSQPRVNYGTGEESRFVYTSSPAQMSVQFVYRY